MSLSPKSLRSSPSARAARIILLAVLLSLGVALPDSGGAQDDPGGAVAANPGAAAATIVPASATVFFGIDSSDANPQAAIAQELLERIDLEEGAAEIGTAAAPVASEPAGEYAFVLLSPGSWSAFPGAAGRIPALEVSKGLAIASPLASGAAIVLSPDDVPATLDEIEAELGAGATSTTTDYEGISITSVSTATGSGVISWSYAVIDDFIVMATTAADVEPFIDVNTGQIPALADFESFQTVEAALPAERVAFAYVDMSLQTTGVVEGETFGLKSLGASVAAEPAGFRFETVAIPIDSPALPAGGLPSNPGEFAELAPEETILFVNGLNLGQNSLVEAVGLVIATVVPLAAGFDVPLLDDGLPSTDELYANAELLFGFDVRSDLIRQLVGEFAFAVWPNDRGTVNAVLMSEVDAPEEFRNSIDYLTFMFGMANTDFTFSTRTVGDEELTVVTVDPSLGAIEYGLVDGRFVLGVGDDPADQLEDTGPRLASSERFAQATAGLPTDSQGLFYVDIAGAQAVSAETSEVTSLESFALVWYIEPGRQRTSSLLTVAER